MAFDFYNQIKPRQATDSVVVIDIDEKSLKELGQWPWSRDVIADMVTNLNQMGARSIVFDMVFAEKDRTSPVELKKYLSPELKEDQDVLDFLSLLPDYDDVFSKAIKEAGNVVTGFVWLNDKDVKV